LDAHHQSFYIFSFDGIRLRNLALALLIGITLYLAIFGFLLHKPLTVGVIARYIEHKERYLDSIKGRQKIVILAGSNGRFSHSCSEIERITGIACANMTISADLDLLWQFHKFSASLAEGDLLYLPLEYQVGADEDKGRSRLRAGGEAAYIVAYNKRELLNYTTSQVMDALFQFDLKFLFSSLGEMALSAAGKERRFSPKTMTVNGDERDHDTAKAQAYRMFVEGLKAPVAERFPKSIEAELIQIFEELRGRGVIVVGGLPTTFNDVALTDGVLDAITTVFMSNGQCFIVLPNRSLYPRDKFYDTAYHLSQDSQIEHSRALAPSLKAIAQARACESGATR
jgi:hypothetical protein